MAAPSLAYESPEMILEIGARRLAGGWLVVLALIIAACTPPPRAATDPYEAVAQLRGRVCGKSMVGSAVVVDRGLLITVAHNVAGSQGDLTVTFEDGMEHPAILVGIDIDRDLALLSVPSLAQPGIDRTEPTAGEQGRIIRLRAQQERAEVPYTDADLIVAVGRNIYNEDSTVRRANVRVRAAAGAGYSGGPVLNDDDRMTGIVYAAASLDDVTYATASSEIDTFLASVDALTEAASERCPR